MPKPIIKTQPADSTKVQGSTANFYVDTSNVSTFLWKYDGTALTNTAPYSAVTTYDMTVSNVQNSYEGWYSVTVTSSDSTSLDSSSAWLDVLVPPTITVQPTDTTVVKGSTASFSVTSPDATAYRWKATGVALSNGGQISGSDTSALTITTTSKTNQTYYSVTLTNADWYTDSSIAQLRVLSYPVILTQPADTTKTVGQDASFFVIGSDATYYQWSKDGTVLTNTAPYSAVTTADMTVSSVINSYEGNYSCAVANADGTTLTGNAWLDVFVPPVISAQPADTTVNVGGTASFSVTAAPATGYQWKKTGAVISDSTKYSGTGTAQMKIYSAADSDEAGYSVVVWNLNEGDVTSTTAWLGVDLSPYIIKQPQPQYKAPGDTAVFSVTAGYDKDVTVAYQWYFGDSTLGTSSRILDVTSATLSISGLVPADAEFYSVKVSNVYGSVTSDLAELTVGATTQATGSPIDVVSPGLGIHYKESVSWILDEKTRLSVGVKKNITL